MTTIADPRMGGTSASGATADSLCAGRHNAQKGIPDVRSDDSRFGDEIHEALRTGDPSKLGVEQTSIYEGCKEIESRLVGAMFGDDVAKAKVFREERYWCKVPSAKPNKDNKFDRHPHSGQADVVYRLGDRAVVLDYKTLPGEQTDSPSNGQLRDLAVMVARHLVVQSVAVAIIQPLVTYTPEVCMYSSDDITRAEKEMFERVQNSNNPDAKRTPGPVQCKFCKAKNKCEEYQKHCASIVPQTPIALTPISQWTPEQRALFCENRQFIQRWLDQCENEMKSILEADAGAIPGWCLEPGDIKEKVTDVNTLHERFVESGGDTAGFMKCVSITKKALKEQVAQATKLKGKKLDEKIKSLLDGLTESKQNAPSLARMKGGKPAPTPE